MSNYLNLFIILLSFLRIQAQNQNEVDKNEVGIFRSIKSARIGNLLNSFNIEILASQWIIVHKKLGESCGNDMSEYLRGLQDGEIWAMKS